MKRLLWTILIAVLLFLVPGCEQRGLSVALPSVGGASGALPPGPSPEPEPPRPEPPGRPILACEVTKDEGIPCKAVVRRPGVPCYGRPGGEPMPDPLPLMRHFYIHHEDSPTPGWLRIGQTVEGSSFCGYVKEEDVQHWNTMLAGLPRADLMVYAKPEEALEEIVSKDGASPRALAQAVAVGGKRQLTPWPILQLRRRRVGKQYIELCQFLFVGDMTESIADPPASRGRRKESRKDVRCIDCLFVVDDTASTRPFSRMIVNSIEATAKALRQRFPDVSVAFEFVLYRDTTAPGLMFKLADGTEAVTKLGFHGEFQTDSQAFLREVLAIEVPTIDSIDPAECAFDGLMELESVRWRERSDRIVVWLSDNSAKSSPEKAYTEARVIAAMKQKAVKPLALCIQGDFPEDQPVHYAQMDRIARACDGQCFRLGDGARPFSDVAEIVAGFHLQEGTVIHLREDWDQRIEEEGREQVVRDTKRKDDLRELYRFLQLLDSEQRPEVHRFVGPDGRPIAFATGWALSRKADEVLVEPHVLVTNPDLNLLLSDLWRLQALLDPDVPSEVLTRTVGVQVDPRSFFAAGTSKDLPFDVYAFQRQVPVSGTRLKHSQHGIKNLSEKERHDLRVYLLEEVIPRLHKFLTTPSNWRTIGRIEIGWVPQRLLP